MALTNFGQQFAAKTLRKFYQTAVTPAVTNTNYEGEIKQAGDRVNILSFLNDISLSDYVAGTDMSVESPIDNQDQLVVEKRKSFNFAIDRLEDLFTYADDISDTLVENASKVLERTIDSYVLDKMASPKAGNWVGINFRVVGNGETTVASILTTATGGTVSAKTADTANYGGAENTSDGGIYVAPFDTVGDVGRPIRLTSGTAWATEWYKITGVTDTNTATIANWDGATSGSEIPNGDILRGLGGGSEYTSSQNGDDKSVLRAAAGWGWEIQAAIPTTITASTLYKAITQVAERLNRGEVPDTDRHLTLDSSGYQILQQASELQPAVAMAYEPIVINGRIGRVLGFDVHIAAGSRVSTRTGHTQVSSAGAGADTVTTNGTLGLQYPGNHISYCTFAYKWAESRIVDAENQFAKKYQGLHLWGALVPTLRLKAGSMLYAAVPTA